MSSLEPRRGRYVSRKQREQRAFLLLVTGGAIGFVSLVGFLLAIVGVVGWGFPILTLIVAAVCLVLFRRAVSGR
jgi:hypothetical protein